MSPTPTDRPHRVLEDDALVGTRLVEAIRAACGPLCAVNPCSTCAPNHNKNSFHDDNDADELRIMHGGDDAAGHHASSPTSAVWSKAYEEFRSSTRRPAEGGGRRGAEVSSQLDEVNARLAADLEHLDAKGGFGGADMSYATPGVVNAPAGEGGAVGKG